MASGGDLLEKMRRSPHGHRQADMARLLKSYGFDAHEGSNHTIYSHELLVDGPVVTVPRHRAVRGYVARQAVKAVDCLIALQDSGDSPEENDG